MHNKYLDIKHIKLFIAVAELRSFTQAAEKYHITQPSLSVQIRNLEESLGFSLFKRNRRQSVYLSKQGSEFLEMAREFARAHERLIQRANLLKEHKELRLTLGYPEYIYGLGEADSVCSTFLERYPHIELEVVNATSMILMRQLRSHELDVVITFGPVPFDDLESLVIQQWKLSILAPASSSLAQQGRVSIEDLRGLEVGLFPRSANRPLFDSLSLELGRYGAATFETTDVSLFGICRFVSRTQKYCLVSQWLTDLQETMSDLVVLEVEGLDIYNNVNIVRRKDDLKFPIDAFWEHARFYFSHEELSRIEIL